MPSQADQQFADIYDQDADFFGVSVRIQRNAAISRSVIAIVEEVKNELETDETLQTVVRSRNYIIAKTDYLVSGVASTPKSGDRILETVGGVDCVFELSAVAPGLPAFEPEHEDGTRWIVRTKKVA